ncbi:uncharacterized protein MAM_03759 [Metarhizium album ARSEF 1941]|uniref:Uncharacterized protein n=1 Tax=Metarhizium album (strain ARSEF 1941) TaxID=1081103 RepID=A0A0B2X0M2_METAS|nr:uncharacterized protein MAM_03759 [Metarhizium album ARSEF 1941]KHN98635.1 hypothetical protein MAM_03759 [Metarhizium album ARSEF 1941]
MASPIRDLDAGSLYVTISLPYSIEDGDAASRHKLNSNSPCGLDIATYEIHCAQDLAQEEFNWGLYFHRGNQDGIWYALTRQDVINYSAAPTLFQLSRQQLKSSPRLHCQVVGLVRILRIPPILCRELTTYLDWLALGSYGTVTRTFIWVTSMYIRTWHHIMPKPENPALGQGIQFDVNMFLREALSFAYAEVQYAIGGQLPRPIIKSAFGLELGVTEGDRSSKNETRTDISARNRKSTLPASSWCVDVTHQDDAD